METIAVFYKIEGDTDSKYNTSFLSVPLDREVLLLDLLQLWMKEGEDRICFTFYAESYNGRKTPLLSPVSVLPVVDQTVHLYLTPSSAPPTGARSSHFPQKSSNQSVTSVQHSRVDEVAHKNRQRNHDAENRERDHVSHKQQAKNISDQDRLEERKYPAEAIKNNN